MTDEFVGIGLLLGAPPSDPERLGSAALRLVEKLGVVPSRMSYRDPLAKSRAFRVAAFEALIRNERVPQVSLWLDGAHAPVVTFFLRFIPDPEVPLAAEFERRWCGAFYQSIRPTLDEAAIAWLHEVAAVTDIVHGCATGGFSSPHWASVECILSSSPPDIDAATDARLAEDSMSWSSKRPRLRRLYPVTIIGPKLWAALPPMPVVDPMPTVEDLGECKMITCWPKLVGPHDPAFLAGTRELRRWLWPYTIQNPADDPESIDRSVAATTTPEVASP